MWVWEDIFPELQKTHADNSVYLQKKILSDPYFYDSNDETFSTFLGDAHLKSPTSTSKGKLAILSLEASLWFYYYSYS